MSRFAALLVLVTIALAAPSHAACYVDYKAKRDNPLRLHYGVMQLPDQACRNPRVAEQMVRQRVSQGGWQLLNVVSSFGEEGLRRRRPSAGQFFLRF